MFQVFYSPGAGKVLKKMPKETARRIIESVEALSQIDNPKQYIKKLKGSFGVPLYYYRVGDPRIILSINSEDLAINIVDVGDRSIIYRNY